MVRPETAQDVADLVRRAKLVGETVLAAIETREPPLLTSTALLGVLVADGLLTPFQASELADGRWQALRLGAYTVLDRLGKGGMGQVYLAEHSVLRNQAAVKVLSAALRSDPTARQRFVREARAAATIQHPNVVQVFTIDMDHDPPFLVMEYVEGISLQAAVAKHGAFSPCEAAVVGVEVARGLQAAAAVGLVHRDVKPANLLIDRRGGVKILDLGIARFIEDDPQTSACGADIILGTLDYLAPEQAEDSTTVDARADLYALGGTLYFLLAGHPPFPASDVRYKLAAKQYTDPPPIHRLRNDVDPVLSGVIQTLLARDPATRYQTAEAVIAALAPFASTPPDFPGRLFRSNHPSTLSDEPRHPAVEAQSLPPTQQILKPVRRSPQTLLTPPPPGDIFAESASTDEVMKLPTAVEIPLPVDPLTEMSVPVAKLPQRGIWLLVGAIVLVVVTTVVVAIMTLR
jgi:serine/threonine protein kinase